MRGATRACGERIRRKGTLIDWYKKVIGMIGMGFRLGSGQKLSLRKEEFVSCRIETGMWMC